MLCNWEPLFGSISKYNVIISAKKLLEAPPPLPAHPATADSGKDNTEDVKDRF